jgi:parvulin-like peptidyl-prolyl isomerase
MTSMNHGRTVARKGNHRGRALKAGGKNSAALLLVLGSSFLALRFLVPVAVVRFSWGQDLRAQTLDRVVAAIGNVAITESDVEAEYRFESFLSRGRVPASAPDATALASVRDGLIDERLLTQEATAEGMQPSDVQPAALQALAEVRKKCGSEEAFQSSLRELGLTEAQLLNRLEEHERMSRIIDLRLRPSVTVEPAEIEAYYRDTFTAEYSKHNPGQGVPPLAQVQSQIREILVQKKVDQQLPAWLDELKSTHHVRVF